MSSVHEMSLVKHPSIQRSSSATPLLEETGTQVYGTDAYEPVATAREVQQTRLTDALQRVQQPSLWRRIGDNAQWSAKKVLQVASDTTLGPHELYNDRGDWHVLKRFPSQEWCRTFVFDSSSARRAAVYRDSTGLAMAPITVQDGKAMGSSWSLRAIVLARAMIHQLFGDVTEAEAIALVRDGLERLKPGAVERRYVAPILRAGHLLGGQSGNDYEVDAGPIRYVVGELRKCFEHLATHLEDDDTRRRIFSVPTSAYFPNLGIVEMQEKKTTESINSFLPQPSGMNFSANIQRFFSREGAPWRIATSIAATVVALAGALFAFVWRNPYAPKNRTDGAGK